MKRFLGFIKKEVIHILRDPRTLLVMFGIPLAQLLIFGYVIRTEIKDVKIAVYDQSKDYQTQRIVNKLTSSGYFILEQNLEDLNGIETIFKKGIVKEVVVFEPGFAKKMEREGNAQLQLLADASDPNVARMVVNYTRSVIMGYMDEEKGSITMPLTVDVSVKMLYNEGLKSVYMFIPGLMAMIMMLITAMMSSLSITKEKEMGTMEVLLVSPLKPAQIVIGKVIPYILLAFIDALVIIAMGHWVFGMPIVGSLGFLMLECVLFILVALSLGILISTIAPNQLIAMFMSMIALMLPTILLSGFIFPIENMPGILQAVSSIMPARWFNEIVKEIMLKGGGLMAVLKETIILMVMVLFFLAVSVRKFKIRLE